MATEHELNIRATLDTSQIQQELDRINQQRGSDGLSTSKGGHSGNDQMSLSFRIRQLQLSIDSLNKMIQLQSTRQMRGQGDGVSLSSSQNLGLPGLLGGNPRMESMQKRIRTAKKAIGAGLISSEDWSNPRKRREFLESPAGQPYQQEIDYANYKEKQASRDSFTRRELRWGLAMGGMVAGELGTSLKEAGYSRSGAAMSILGGALGGAGSGAMVGGPWGAAIGGFFGFVTSASSELQKLANAANAASEAMFSAQKKSVISYAEYANQEKFDALSRAVEAASRSPLDLANYQKQIEQARTDSQKELFNAKSLYEFYQKSAEKMSGTPEQRTEAYERAMAQLKEVQQAKGEFAQWERLSQTVKDKFQEMADETERNHQEGLRLQKMEEDFRHRLFEEQERQEEMRKNLLSQREALLLSIEQEYAQRGVDVLSSMGKSGKFMSQMESASTSQERYAPITKKLDTMQKSLDHLSQIDAKLRTLNTGLL